MINYDADETHTQLGRTVESELVLLPEHRRE